MPLCDFCSMRFETKQIERDPRFRIGTGIGGGACPRPVVLYFVGNQKIDYIEWRILEVLFQRAGRVIPDDTVIALVWGDGTTTGNYKVRIHHIRQALAKAPETGIRVERFWGQGYRLIDEQTQTFAPT